MNLYNETKYILKKYNIFANKKLGQNFLVDDLVVEEIINSSNISEKDLIIEIGPGLGTLTKPLLEKAGKLICIELDKRMLNILKDRFSMYKNFNIINEDVLKVDLKELIEKEKNGEINQVKVVANLPYYITTPIIMKLLENNLNIKTITVMVQKEVADRLIVKPGKENTGAITYAIDYYTNPERVCDVQNTSFVPAPEVNSTVIKLHVLKNPKVKVENSEVLFKIIKLSFMQKRKTLLNGLSNASQSLINIEENNNKTSDIVIRNVLGNKAKIEKMLLELNLDLKTRAEKLTLEDFAKITEYVLTSPTNH